jgi:hypothetical protein
MKLYKNQQIEKSDKMHFLGSLLHKTGKKWYFSHFSA